jgi:hypothetical protein
MVRVHFSIGLYFDYADCDVVPMEACSLCWVDLGNMILMHVTMVGVIHTLLGIKIKTLLCYL